MQSSQGTVSYEDFFKAITGLPPFPYQVALANGAELPMFLDVPTGCGKTAAVVLGWLWRRRFAAPAIRHNTPRRLVYTLPMRTLVEQTTENCRRWLERLELTDNSHPVLLQTLMGGMNENEWELWPERDAILVGTQDMLLSRALNRGYATSRYRWPVQFGLINNDCLWVYDETQLMGAGLATTAQLDAFRGDAPVQWPCRSLWVSATLGTAGLMTVDASAKLTAAQQDTVRLTAADEAHQAIARRVGATKVLDRWPSVLSKTDGEFAQELATRIVELHSQRGGRTLVILNSVARAQDLFRCLRRLAPPAELLLVHSRFRRAERESITQRLLSAPADAGRIIVATQAIEAGLDISSRTMITELAPWSSLVQRCGRCNRYGEEQDARVYWIDIAVAADDAKPTGLALPYNVAELLAARDALVAVASAAPRDLAEVDIAATFESGHILRRKDILDLFDTTPDLAGADLDVSPFIRSGSDQDVLIYWRDLAGAPPADDLRAPAEKELCTASIGNFRSNFFARLKRLGFPLWIRNHVEGRWQKLEEGQIRPGLVVLCDTSAGGYDLELGWQSASDAPVTPLDANLPTNAEEQYSRDPASHSGRFLTISDHTENVVAEVHAILADLALDPELATELLVAARWHDRGKAHPIFQELLMSRGDDDPPVPPGGPWAKSDRPDGRPHNRSRPQFRHELASALAGRQEGLSDLACYLVAAHHGKVRVSIRSLPGELVPPSGARFARGVWEGDSLPATALGDGVVAPHVIMDLSEMELGDSEHGPSWLDRALRLRQRHGPFLLAYLEALLRSGDQRASAKEVK